jgi:hypothetical protein
MVSALGLRVHSARSTSRLSPRGVQSMALGAITFAKGSGWSHTMSRTCKGMCGQLPVQLLLSSVWTRLEDVQTCLEWVLGTSWAAQQLGAEGVEQTAHA